MTRRARVKAAAFPYCRLRRGVTLLNGSRAGVPGAGSMTVAGEQDQEPISAETGVDAAVAPGDVQHPVEILIDDAGEQLCPFLARPGQGDGFFTRPFWDKFDEEAHKMASTDIDGSPILILSYEDVKLVKVCLSFLEAEVSLGDVRIKNPEKFKNLTDKIDKFLQR